MSLAIFVNKADFDKTSAIFLKLEALCVSVVERDELYIFLPLGGKLIPALKLLAENGISYELKDPTSTNDQISTTIKKSGDQSDFSSRN